MQSSLPIVESFHSIQGEGRHAGRSAFFIRLASCIVGCSWCDTKNSWSADHFKLENVINLSEEVVSARSQGAAFVVITGGEPLHHNLNELCQAIRKNSNNQEKLPIPIHLETSGVDPLSGNPSGITLSPKRHAPPLEELIQACQELKVVIHEKEDLIFAENMAKKTRRLKKPLLFLQPGWDNETGQKLAVEYVRNHPKWRLSMQTHKWLNVL